MIHDDHYKLAILAILALGAVSLYILACAAALYAESRHRVSHYHEAIGRYVIDGAICDLATGGAED